MQEKDKNHCQLCGTDTEGYEGKSRFPNVTAICSSCSLVEMMMALQEWGIVSTENGSGFSS